MNAPALLLRAVLMLTLAASLPSCFGRVTATTPASSGFRVWSSGEVGIAWLRGNPEAECVVTVLLPPDAQGVANLSNTQGDHGKRQTVKKAVFGLGENGEELTIQYEARWRDGGGDSQHAISINDTPYSLVDGLMFTVDARGEGPPKVEQY